MTRCLPTTNFLLTDREAVLGNIGSMTWQYESHYARLVSSLLYGTRAMHVCFLLERTSGHLNSEGIRCNVFLMKRATRKAKEATITSLNKSS